ncbi:MAG: phosphoribosylamine--glycine ligase [Armatimonadetes bacterium]|nr:phosphoribosylamine--glycine ligase [Armatimonadota bacterium]
MQVLVIGGGGREHALCWRLAQSPSVTRLLALPGNPGIAAVATCLPGSVDDIDHIVAVARRESVDLVVVGPEAPLVAGLADRLRAAGIATFGPDAAPAQIEGSKVFSKELFRAAGVPTAAFECFDSSAEAKAYLRRMGAPIVVKADGLCAGKGAIMCATLAEAELAVTQLLDERAFGAAGERIVIEACLNGPEMSVFALVDGETVVPLPVAQDHKRALDGDRGLNTGGMGAYSPVPLFSDALIEQAIETCVKPTARALAERGMPYRGVLFGGFLITDEGPQTLEYNCRFGDPETQVLMPRIEGDFGEACLATATGQLDQVEVRLSNKAAACVVMASGGYPEAYATGLPIGGLAEAEALDGVVVFHAGTRLVDGQVVTAGGRVLGVTATGDDLRSTVARAYEAVDRITFEGAHCRRDIAWQAL